MKITFLTVFPQAFSSFLDYPVIDRAVRNGLVTFEIIDIRDYADGCFRAVDDSPYGGGAGLLLRADTVINALGSVINEKSKTILLGPKGKKFTQAMAHELAKKEHIILIAGHFEGIDERVRKYTDEEVSIGDYILTGGESAAVIVAEAVTRLLDGALRGMSAKEESFENGILEHPQYTHPAVFEGCEVPSVLLSGNRKMIDCFNETEAVKTTARLRPDLLSRDRDFTYCMLHREYGNEAEIIRWLKDRLPVPEILYEDETFLVLAKKNGKPLRDCNRNRILKTCAAILKAFWALDVSDCPCNEGIEATVGRLKKKSLSHDSWCTLQDLEETPVSEETVFSHGSLTLDSIIVNGNGLVYLTDLQKAGFSDRYRDLACLIPSLEEIGIAKEELFALLGFNPDETRLAFFGKLKSCAGNGETIACTDMSHT